MAINIKVLELIKSNLDHEDGSRLYHVVQNALRDQKTVEIDFSGLEVLTSSFLNTSFRLLIKDYEYEFLKTHLSIINSNGSINKAIRETFDIAMRNPTEPIVRADLF